MESYDLLSSLGKGAAGTVFLVRHRETKRLFALKKIQLDETKKSRTKDAVEKEARILSNLKHPHIVMFHESFLERQASVTSLCIVQDYCDGGSLDQKIADHKENGDFFSENQIMQWFIQLVMAVQYIHSQKILHRDLKSQNVFLTKKEVIKLGDFGIAKTLEHTIDKASTMVGTPSHMSPELCHNQPYNNKSDIWSLGCLLFEICAFEPAFDATSLLALVIKIMKGEYAEFPTNFSSDLQGLIKTLLLKDPESRPSASAILSLPFIKVHLNRFISDRENQIQLSNHQRFAESLKKRPSSAGRLSEQLIRRSKGQSSRCKSAMEARNNNELIGDGDNIQKHNKWKTAIPEPRESGEYSDDFSSSGEESEDDDKMNQDQLMQTGKESLNSGEEEDEIPEVLSPECEKDAQMMMDSPTGSLSSGVSPEAISTDVSNVEYADEAVIDEYADDFEEIESDEDLDEILMNARTAAEGRDAVYSDDSFEEDEDQAEDGRRCRKFIEEHCKEVLGEDVFEEMQTKMKNNQGQISASDLRLEFEHKVGKDLKETCYLLTELLLPSEAAFAQKS